jgi:hypothetical protein
MAITITAKSTHVLCADEMRFALFIAAANLTHAIYITGHEPSGFRPACSIYPRCTISNHPRCTMTKRDTLAALQIASQIADTSGNPPSRHPARHLESSIIVFSSLILVSASSRFSLSTSNDCRSSTEDISERKAREQQV